MPAGLLIVAGGSGSRMGGSLPKQFIELNGKTVLEHTLRKFFAFSAQWEVAIVAPKDFLQLIESLRQQWPAEWKITIAEGGSTRFHSVRNGLAYLNTSIIAVHDAVRPCVSLSTIKQAFEKALQGQAAVPSLPLSDSIRRVHPQGFSSPEDRNAFRLIQTPQIFPAYMLKKAFEQSYEETFTDCASVVQAAGFSIQLCEGNKENIKITFPEDLAMAKIWLERQQREFL